MSGESGKDCLPHGWIVRTSSKFPDRIYYFNTVTGNSTWECPELVPRKKEASTSKVSSGGLKTNNISSQPSNTSSSGIKPSSSDKNTPQLNIAKNTSLKRPSEAFSTTSQKSSTSKASIPANLRIPTAIVAPVNASEEITPNPGSSSNSSRRRNRRRSKAALRARSTPAVAALPTSVQETSVKRLRISPSAAPNPNEADSTDSDMELEFGSALRSTPSTSDEMMAFERTLSNSSGGEVEMLDVSGDLTSLDEMLLENNPSQFESYFIVVDTNVLLHDIQHLELIIETPLKGCGPPHIIIPWIVVSELDCLKKKNDIPGKLAQRAVRFMYKMFKSKHPRFHGQSAKEAHKILRKYHNTNDDKMIDVCLSLIKRMNPEKVILMTNDKNLANKSMIYKLNVHDYASLIKDITPDTVIEASPIEKREQKNIANKELSPEVMTREHQRLVLERCHYEEEKKALMRDAKQMLQNALDPYLVEELQKTYGPSWEQFQIDRRFIREILAAYLKFWPTVFYKDFSKKIKNSFDFLQKKASCLEGFDGTSEEYLMVLHAIYDIIRAIVKVRPNMSFLMGHIQMLQDHYSHVFSKCSMVDSSISDVEITIKDTEANLVLSVLNHNWTVLNEICGMVCDFYGVRHTFQYSKPEKLPDESEYRRVVADLYPSILQLQAQMKKMMGDVINGSHSDRAFKGLANSLKTLIPSLNIQAVVPDNFSHLSSELVEQFCRKIENRQKIEIGYQQLQNFGKKLSEAIQAMITFKKNRPSST